MYQRRKFLLQSASALGGLLLPDWARAAAIAPPVPLFFKISLAQWSLNRTLFAEKMNSLDFPRVARETYGVDAVEYVNQFFKDKAKNQAYLQDLKQRCADHGVRSLLIMIDGEGDLGDTHKKARKKAVENHYKWVDAAHFLGCHSIRVNAFGQGNAAEVGAAATAGLRRLGTYAAQAGLNVIVENHGGHSSNGQWLAQVIQNTQMANVGTLPDFGNFCVRRDSGQEWGGQCLEQYDPYQGVSEMMPFAKGVSAKSHRFDANGIETSIDYVRMLRIVKAAQYQGYIGIEYEGDTHSEEEGIKLTKALLEKAGAAV